MMQILDKIFSKTKSNDNIHTTYNFLGLKIKTLSKDLLKKEYFLYKNRNEQLYSTKNLSFATIFYLLRICDSYDILLNYLSKHASDNISTYNNFDFRIKLIHIALLLLTNKEDAKKIFLEYYKKHKLNGVEQNLAVSSLAQEMGYTNKYIEKAAYVYKKMKSSKAKNEFKDFIYNKKIAFVGNGPYQIGKNTGAEIDAHDIVIRINNFKIKGFEQDYGVKTNIFARGVAPDIENKTDENFKFIILPTDFDTYILSNSIPLVNYLYENLINGKTIISSDYYTKKEFKKRLPNINPTTGFHMLWELYYILGNIDNIDFYGFSFLNDTGTNDLHYFDKRKVESITRHDFNAEGILMKRFIEEVKHEQ